MRNLLKIAEPDEALHREIMLSLGYPKNKVQFLELALILPYKEIKNLKERQTIEKALLYRAGFCESKEGLPNSFDFSLKMDRSVWELKGIRPANHPDKRIKGISHLLAQTVSEGLLNFFTRRITQEMNKIQTQMEAKKCVDRIMNFQGIGQERKREMFFNIILPFTIAYYEKNNPDIIQFLRHIFKIHPPLLENSITKAFRKGLTENSDYLKLNTSTKTYFGILFYMKKQAQ